MTANWSVAFNTRMGDGVEVNDELCFVLDEIIIYSKHHVNKKQQFPMNKVQWQQIELIAHLP